MEAKKVEVKRETEVAQKVEVGPIKAWRDGKPLLVKPGPRLVTPVIPATGRHAGTIDCSMEVCPVRLGDGGRFERGAVVGADGSIAYDVRQVRTLCVVRAWIVDRLADLVGADGAAVGRKLGRTAKGTLAIYRVVEDAVSAMCGPQGAGSRVARADGIEVAEKLCLDYPAVFVMKRQCPGVERGYRVQEETEDGSRRDVDWIGRRDWLPASWFQPRQGSAGRYDLCAEDFDFGLPDAVDEVPEEDDVVGGALMDAMAENMEDDLTDETAEDDQASPLRAAVAASKRRR
jgi:hypothetical protein